MSAATTADRARQDARLPWRDILPAAITSVSWALSGMAATAAVGAHLLGMDSGGSPAPMAAALMALAVGGSVTTSGEVSAFGWEGARAHTAVEATPLGVSLVGALLLSYFFLRSLRGAGAVIAPSRLLVRAAAVVVLFVAALGALVRAGHGVVAIDGGAVGLDRVTGGGGSGGPEIPGLGNAGDIGGLLPDAIGDLVDVRAAIAFSVRTAPTLLAAAGWAAGVLLLALLTSRRTPLPRGFEAVHRVVRPAVSALAGALLVAVAAGLAAAAYAAAGDAHPGRVVGAALLGAPNGVWSGLPLGLFVPSDGTATGALARLLPGPLDTVLTARPGRPVTLERLAALDGRVWLLAVGAAAAMLLAGVLTAVRTPPERAGARAPSPGTGAPGSPVPAGGGRAPLPAAAAESWAVGGPGSGSSSVGGPGALRGPGGLRFVGQCAVRLGVVTALVLPLLVRWTEVSLSASVSVLGIDALDAGIDLHGHGGTAALLGAVWGAGAGAAGALLARATGAAGRRAAPLARGDGRIAATAKGRGPAGPAGSPGSGERAGHSGVGWDGSGGTLPDRPWGPYGARPPDRPGPQPQDAPPPDRPWGPYGAPLPGRPRWEPSGAPAPDGPGREPRDTGPPDRPPRPVQDTWPPDRPTRPPRYTEPPGRPVQEEGPDAPSGDLYSAPTVAGPLLPPPLPPRPRLRPMDWPPPPPDEPPAPPPPPPGAPGT
ncbi:streptophobe family protein [Streptomyces sp. NPDC003697]